MSNGLTRNSAPDFYSEISTPDSSRFQIEPLSETESHERQDTSQHIRQQNTDNERVEPDLGVSSGVKTRKTRSKVWDHFEKHKDKNGEDWARCNVCKKDFRGSSKSGTTHLRNHFDSCQRKKNGGGGRGMIITEERSEQVHDAGRARSTRHGSSHSLGTIKVGPWPGGVLGGSAWDFKSDGNAVIKDIVIKHGQVVDSVTFTSIHRTTGDIIAKAKFGGPHGLERDQISINWPEEYLTLISGTINQYAGHTVIESLNFHTNRKKYGPYGYTRGNSFETPLENGEIVGFFGRSGSYLDAIGFYVIPSAD